MQTQLLNPSAPALNQQNQHDNKQDAANNSNNRGTVHIESLLSSMTHEQFERTHHRYDRGTQGDQE